MHPRNYIQPHEMPYTTPNGCVCDSGNYPAMLKEAQELTGWDGWQKRISGIRKKDAWPASVE
jgi:2-furoyl-CoA dehydrogenase large subunit